MTADGHLDYLDRNRILKTRPVEVALRDLKLTMSTRSGPRDTDHIRTLAEQYANLPPILVHRASSQVIDGVHRVQAARLLGHDTVRAIYFDGSHQEALVLSIQANIAHGKPLSIAERKAACRRLMSAFSVWSDRRIAQVCGLSSATVAQERAAVQCVEGGDSRIGRDGRSRPSDPGAVRLRVADHIRLSPTAPLRDVAREVGTSQATVLDVKRRLERGESPLPKRYSDRELQKQATTTITADAAFLSNAESVDFARWFDGHRIVESDIARADHVPVGRTYLLADEARRRADLWTRMSVALEERARKNNAQLTGMI